MTMGTIIWIVFIGGVFFMMMRKCGGCCGGHGGRNHGGGGEAGHDSCCGMEHHGGHKEEVAGLKDPVCGMTVKDDSITHEYGDKSYSFCSESCKEKFVANPADFVR